MNISPTSVVGKCDLKCSYQFKYSEMGNITMTNNGTMIAIDVRSNQDQNHVKYNMQKYTPTTVSIVCPSIHLFQGMPTAAELWITHSPTVSGPVFQVGIPIIASGGGGDPQLTNIIQTMSSNAPSMNETCTLSSLNLQDWIPSKPFFSFTEESSGSDWIVFGMSDALSISPASLETMKTMIQPFIASSPSSDLFYNSLGPNSISDDNGIYISCTPTGSSDTEVAVVTPNKNSTDTTDATQGLIWLAICLGGIIGLFIILWLVSMAYNKITVTKNG